MPITDIDKQKFHRDATDTVEWMKLDIVGSDSDPEPDLDDIEIILCDHKTGWLYEAVLDPSETEHKAPGMEGPKRKVKIKKAGATKIGDCEQRDAAKAEDDPKAVPPPPGEGTVTITIPPWGGGPSQEPIDHV